MSNWALATLGDVAQIEREVIGPEAIRSGTSYVGLEHITSEGTFALPPVVEQGELASAKFSFTSSHLLYGKLRPYLSKIARPDFNGVCSTDILPVRPGSKLDRNYLHHCLRLPSMVALANSRSVGANLPRLSPGVLAAFEIPLPPLPEQRRIAEVLDRAETLRAQRRQALAQLDALAESIFFDMFGDPVSNSKKLPEGAFLGDVADVVSGITKGRPLKGQAARSVPYLAVSNVHDRSLSLGVVKTIEATKAEIARYRLLDGDLLLTEGGDPDKLGRGTLWRSELPECIHQNHIFRVRVTSPNIRPLYLSWLVGSQRGKRYFLRSAKQTTGIASINMTQLKGFPLLTPPLSQQEQFEHRLKGVSVLRAAHVRAATEVDALFASLQHRAFRGEL